MEENLTKVQSFKKLPVWPTVFLIFVFVVTVWLYAYNYYLTNENSNLSTEKDGLTTAISSKKEDKNIQVFDLLKKSSFSISKMELNNKVVTYIEHLADISKKYGLNFSGFSLNNGEIKTEVTARKIAIRWNAQTYEKISKFIKEYKEDEERLFDLDFINSFEWMDEMKFSVNFKIRQQKEKTVESSTWTLDSNSTKNEQ